MPKKSFQQFLIESGWRFLASGSYNDVFFHEQTNRVLKIAKEPPLGKMALQTDAAERSVRLWNEINSAKGENIAEIEKFTTNYFNVEAWTAPYIEGDEPFPHEIAETILDIFNKTGRIIVDGASRENFIKTPEGKIYCIDIGLALALEYTEEFIADKRKLSPLEEKISTPSEEKELEKPRKKRKTSITSIQAWEMLEDKYNTIIFQNHASFIGFNLTVNTIKALLFIRKYRPDIDNANFLKENDFALVDVLSQAYDAQYFEDNTKKKKTIIDKAKILLTETVPPDLNQLKSRCIEVLQEYIDSRVKTEESKVKVDYMSYFFRDSEQIKLKITLTKELIGKISEAETMKTIEDLLHAANKNPAFTKTNSRFVSSSLKKSLAFCLVMTENVQRAHYSLTAKITEESPAKKSSLS